MGKLKRGLAPLCLAALLLACSPAARAGKQAAAAHDAARGDAASGDAPSKTASPATAAQTPAPSPEGGTSGALPAASAQPSAPSPEQPQAGDHHLVFQGLPLTLSSGRLFGPASAGSPLAPEDFAIGPLADSRPESLDEAAALAAARAFLDGVVKGSYREDLALPGRKPLLALLSSPLFKDPRPASYRIGKLKISQDGAGGEEVAACRLRLGGPVQKAEGVAASGAPPPAIQTGEIGLRLENKVWYVESITLDEAKAGRGSPFVPGLGDEE
jgi:hypothetical protein